MVDAVLLACTLPHTRSLSHSPESLWNITKYHWNIDHITLLLLLYIREDTCTPKTIISFVWAACVDRNIYLCFFVFLLSQLTQIDRCWRVLCLLALQCCVRIHTIIGYYCHRPQWQRANDTSYNKQHQKQRFILFAALHHMHSMSNIFSLWLCVWISALLLLPLHGDNDDDDDGGNIVGATSSSS